MSNKGYIHLSKSDCWLAVRSDGINGKIVASKDEANIFNQSWSIAKICSNLSVPHSPDMQWVDEQ